MLTVSAARPITGNEPDSAATPESFRKSRRRMVIRCLRAPSTTLARSAYLESFPRFLFARGLIDRGFRQRFGFLGGGNGLVEIPAAGRLFRGSQGRSRRGPLIAQRAGLFVGGFSRGVGGLEIGFGRRSEERC